MFQGISTALTALYAGRLALETTGNNIANVNTEGYSRQRVEQSSINNSGISFNNIYNGAGGGVNVDDIKRMRDIFLETRGLQEHTREGDFKRMSDTYSRIELSFGEPGDTGLQAQMGDFWASWDDLAANPGEPSARTGVVEQAQTLVTSIQQSAGALKSLRDDTLYQLRGDVSQINSLAKNISDLNVAIRQASNGGSPPNSLMDQRDKLVNDLSNLVGIKVEPTAGNSVAITVNGFALVRDGQSTFLQVDDSGPTAVLRWDADKDPATTTDGVVASVTGGDVTGLLTSLNSTIPRYRALLDSVASNVITAVNTLHTSGLDRYGNPGAAFFVGTDAATISVNPAVVADSKLVAAAKAGGGPLDIDNARAIADLATAMNGPDAEYREMMNILGTESQRSSNQLDIQAKITSAVDAARQSASGVSLDEEMTSMVRYQQGYNAAAKYLSVLNDTLGSLLGMLH